MAINFSKPATADTYTAFVAGIQANHAALAQLLDSAQTTITGTPPTYAKRYNRTTTALEEYNGSAWAPIALHGFTFNSAGVGRGGTPIAPFHQFGQNASSMGALFTSAVGVGSVGNGANIALVNAGTQGQVRANWYYNGVDAAAQAGYSPFTVWNFTTGDIDFYRTTSVAAGAGIAATLAMRLAANGNVGFGLAPSFKVHAEGPNAVAIGITSGASGSYTSYGLGRTTVEGYLSVAAAPNNFVAGSVAGDITLNTAGGSLLFGVGSTLGLKIDTTGRVGAGRSPAMYPLEAAADFGVFSGSVNMLVSAGGGAFGAVGPVSNHPLVLLANNAEAVRVDTSGRVGIGTAAPASSSRLHVAGAGGTNIVTDRAEVLSATNNAGGIEFRGGSSASASASQIYARLMTEATTSGAGTQNGALIIQTANAGTVAEKWRVSSAGYLQNTGNTQPGFSAYKAGAGTVGTLSSIVTVIFDVEDFDNGNCYDHTTGIFTAPVAGRYQVSLSVFPSFGVTVATSEQFSVHLYKNSLALYGAGPVAVVTKQTTAAQTLTHASWSRVVSLAAGDTLRVRAGFGDSSSQITGMHMFSVTLVN